MTREEIKSAFKAADATVDDLYPTTLSYKNASISTNYLGDGGYNISVSAYGTDLCADLRDYLSKREYLTVEEAINAIDGCISINDTFRIALEDAKTTLIERFLGRQS